MPLDKEPPKNPDVQQEAIAWWVKCDAGPLLHSDRAAFEAWLTEDPSHRAALDEVEALCGQVRALAPEQPGARKGKSQARRLVVAGLAAAAIALIFSFDELSLLWRADFRTGSGEVRQVSLADGSRVELAPGTAIAVDFSGGRRHLTLFEGEAFFEPVPDAARPFVVAAAGGTVTALGTAFDIALEDAQAIVTVTQHRVAIANRGETRTLSEGQQSLYGPGLPITPPAKINARDTTAWRRGKLVFVNERLADVITILARYHHGYLGVLGNARELRVTGVFEVADPIGVTRSIESALGIHATRLTDYVVILHE
jgi:transmembrane sensor